MKVLKTTLITLNATFLTLLVLWFFERYPRHLILGFLSNLSLISDCPKPTPLPAFWETSACIGNFPIEFALNLLNTVLPLLLPIVLFLDIFWLIRRFVKKS